MCGINGILTCETNPVDTEILKRMNHAVLHRGPDEEGYFLDRNIGLGHRRLSIIDLDSGRQPIFNEDRTIVIILNGEIYNFLELKEDLEKRGHHFSTKTDTEVIVHLYEELGVNCLHKLNGVFAFALWDKKKEQLLMAVDRLGVKPLIYHWDGKRLIFSSEIGAILASRQVETEIDVEALNLYLSLGYIPAPWTIYKRIRRLQPAHYLLVQKGKLSLHRYWNALVGQDKTNYSNFSFDAAKEYLLALLKDAINLRLISDVPLGAFLSGGIDSSIIVSLMASFSNSSVKTFSIGYQDNGFFDETSYAKEVASLNQTDHNEFKLDHRDVLSIIPKVLDSLGEPFADYSLIPTYVVAQKAHKHVKVALSGDGGDELFAGYDKYLGEYYQKIYFQIPSWMRRNFIEPFVRLLPISRQSGFTEFIRKVRKFIDGVDESQVKRHFGWMKLLSHDLRKELLNSKFIMNGEPALDLIEDLYREYSYNAASFDRINAMLYMDLSFELPYNMLVKVDLAGMWNSLEIRSPFLDHRLVEFLLGLPGNFKLRGAKRKYILHKTFDHILPSAIRKRPKMGFDLPMGEWLKKELKETFLEVVIGQNPGKDDLINQQTLIDIYDEHCQNRADHTKILWALFVLQWWAGKNGV